MCHKYIYTLIITLISGGDSVKKIIALLLVFASLFTFAACKGEGGETTTTDPVGDAIDFAEAEASVRAEQSKEADERASEEAAIQEEIDEHIAKVGKTKKKTQIVVELKREWGREFHRYEFNRKGEYKTQMIYHFYDTSELYYAEVEAWKHRAQAKVTDKDKDMKMIVVKNDRFNGRPFDEMYELFKSEEVRDRGYTIIE